MNGKINEQTRELTIDEIDAVNGGSFTQFIQRVRSAFQSQELTPQGLNGGLLGGPGSSLGN
jgi:hypothetical protein